MWPRMRNDDEMNEMNENPMINEQTLMFTYLEPFLATVHGKASD